jgi:hypothetical protein
MEISITSSSEIEPPKSGNLITVLSIDGGGIRGILPGVILAYLEAQLQVIYRLIYIYIYISRIFIAKATVIFFKAYIYIFGSNQV